VGISEGCFDLSLRLITFGGRSVHLAYLVHKSGRKTSTIIIIFEENVNRVCKERISILVSADDIERLNVGIQGHAILVEYRDLHPS
jgi:hypothetical protein